MTAELSRSVDFDSLMGFIPRCLRVQKKEARGRSPLLAAGWFIRIGVGSWENYCV